MHATPRRTAAALALALLAACGSTVPAARRGTAAASSNAEASLGNRPGGGATGTGTSDAASAATGGSGSGSTGSGLSGATRSSGSSAGGTSGSAARVAPVASHAPIEIGIGVDRNDAAFAAAFGVTTSQPEERTVATAIVTDINKRGGFAGHPVVPVYSEFDNTSSDWIAQDQASCATFTQDHHVLAVVRNDDIFGPLDTCVAQAGIPLVLYESYFRAPSWYRASAGLRYVPDNPSPTRLYGALAGRMVATGRWTPATKIGLVRYDRGDQAEIETQSVRPALAARGLRLAAADAVHTPESFQDIGTTGGQMAAVVVRFRQAGVTDVLFEGGDLSYLFATAADAQGYTPRYALTSFDFPNGMPPDQMHGAFGVGWEPSDDVLTPVPVTPGVQRCQQATKSTNPDFAAAGIDRVYATCDLLFWLEAVYAAAGDVGPGAVAAGAKRLAAGFAPAFTFAIDTSAHPDGAAASRDLSYDDKCSCLVYGQQSSMP